ncbi:MAG: M20/M25/M40 family metallo-hydrolase [Bdellovibrionales bacterium]|nr:M20/M25/M40 family metallo-hydrolase [Bdellovibrionales bacterium]
MKSNHLRNHALSAAAVLSVCGTPGCVSESSSVSPLRTGLMSEHPNAAQVETDQALKALAFRGPTQALPDLTDLQRIAVEHAIVATTKDLVSFHSTKDKPDQLKAVIDYVESRFQGTAFVVQRFEKEGVHSVVISRSDSMNFSNVFLGHLDVVEHLDEEMFDLKREGDKLVGRGASDMKGACATMLELFLNNQDDSRLDNAALIFTTDEEVGGFRGLASLIKDHNLRADMVFNPDGAYSFFPSISEKGILHLRLTAQGVGAHGSRPWQGRNAIELLMSDVQRVKGLYEFATEAHPQVISFNLGKVSGGEATNSVPASAVAQIDIRFPPDMTAAEIRSRIAGALENSFLEVLVEGDPVGIDATDEALLDYLEALKTNGVDPVLMHEQGSSDARWFTEQGASIILTKVDGSSAHVDHEYATVSGLVKLYEILDDFLTLVQDNTPKSRS